MIQPSDQDCVSGYWSDVLEHWRPTLVHRLWRAHSDAVNRDLLRRWLPSGTGSLLKTDLFDEAVGAGLYEELDAGCESVCGIDVSEVVSRARARYPSLTASVADVLKLPFSDGSFDAVFSNSTLDHLDSHPKLRAGVAELARTIRPGGSLLITLDNRANPIVAVRTSKLMYAPLHRLGVIPYFVGVTHGPRALTRMLQQTGFDVQGSKSIMHCPPQLAAAVRMGLGRGRVDERSYLRAVLRFEKLQDWFTHALTGHFVAVRAVKR